ncbi:ClpXP protease specificity-enhancing factor [Halomonadaceae bacterium KBTZ08]
MRSSRPYLIRALNDWILDNGATPHLVVDAGMNGVQVPADYVSNGQIVLNISPSAVKELVLGDDAVSFTARFGGVPVSIYVPAYAVMAIYARENGQGMVFGQEPGDPEPPDGPSEDEGDQDNDSDSGGETNSKRPNLKVVK